MTEQTREVAHGRNGVRWRLDCASRERALRAVLDLERTDVLAVEIVRFGMPASKYLDVDTTVAASYLCMPPETMKDEVRRSGMPVELVYLECLDIPFADEAGARDLWRDPASLETMRQALVPDGLQVPYEKNAVMPSVRSVAEWEALPLFEEGS